jgi:Fe-S-cluster containining protein
VKECNQCGKCCTKYSDGGLSATASEIEWWETFEPDIARYVNEGKIWMDPETGLQLKLCPWLNKVPNEKKYTCGIYFNRPDDCRHYPVNIDEMIRDECEMLELRDLSDPGKAQRKLDIIMSDSRPPLSGR